MAGERPPPFTTVPHGFHYHYDEPPRTPERETTREQPAPRVPSPRGFRVRRRARPRINTSISSRTSEIMAGLHDTPLPSIEISDQQHMEPTLLDSNTIPNERYLSPQPFPAAAPRTPEPQASLYWKPSLGEIITCPRSPFSSISDSSDNDSVLSSEDGFSYGGSATSPESDAPDPFSFNTPDKMPHGSQDVDMGIPSSPSPKPPVQKRRWTKEMDNHIWAIYMSYINDPTVTPFKTLPGSAPPVGVCHRVAREAKRSWKGGKVFSAQDPKGKGKQTRGGSPDTLTERSGSNTPTVPAQSKYVPWPGSGSSTRKRLRELCKRKATIAPHYQRMLQSRSPSPFIVQPFVRSTRGGSPLSTRDSFATRDVAMSLATSTAVSMRRDGPLAQMSQASHHERLHDEWFNNEPQGPWASPAPIPSDVDQAGLCDASSIRRLASPFGAARTWGPSQSRQQERPALTHLNTETSIPRLRSPVHFASVPGPRNLTPINLVPRTPKRPAQNELEEEMSGTETGYSTNKDDDIFGGSTHSGRRRVRTRGLSLGERMTPGNINRLSEPATLAFPSITGPITTGACASFPRPNSSPIGLELIRDHINPRLGSPFPGIGGRPMRVRRHIASYDFSHNLNDLDSIDQRLDQAAHENFQ